MQIEEQEEERTDKEKDESTRREDIFWKREVDKNGV